MSFFQRFTQKCGSNACESLRKIRNPCYKHSIMYTTETQLHNNGNKETAANSDKNITSQEHKQYDKYFVPFSLVKSIFQSTSVK